MSQAQCQEHKSHFTEVGKPIEWWIGRELGPLVKRCGSCKTPAGRSLSRKIVGALPQRLVVVPGQFVQGLISDATSDHVQFSYWSADGEQKATYRWLGGVYYRNHHFRLYWIDGESTYPEPHVRVYDGRQASGAIVGGIPAFSHNDKVPPSWSRAPTILYYERVDEVALVSAANSIRTHFETTLSSALCVESIGAQAPDVADQEQTALEDSRASGDGAEEGGEFTVTKQDGFSHEEAGIEVSELGPGGPEAFSNIDQPETLSNNEDIQPNQLQGGPSEEPTETVKDASGDDKDQDNSDNESMTGNSPEEDNNGGESGKEGQMFKLLTRISTEDSDHDDDKPDDNQDESKESNTDNEEEGNDDGPRDNSSGDHEGQGSPRPPKSPSKTPPQSPAKSPRTPPPKTPPLHQAQQGGLFANFSPSRLIGLFTPLRSGTKSEPPPETRAPSPALNLAQKNIDPFVDDDIPRPNAPVSSSSSSDLSLLDASSDSEAPFSPLLPTPPVTPAKKRSRIIPSSILGSRRSQRTFKPRTSGRTAQMIPMNTRTAGSMGPYKPLPASRGVLVAAQDMGGRGRSSVRMSAVVVGQKRSSSASSVSSTGSSTAGYGGSGGRSGGATKRVRFATIRG
ncbi:MAG: hypothetical protein LQ337_003976 [Flavoplaca oasis]|nr:MAG: hypothetical protein LQ337_003976 [Flavoplaca oasis]